MVLFVQSSEGKQALPPSYNSYVGMSVDSLYRKALQNENKGDFDSALTFYSIVYNNYSVDNKAENLRFYGLSLLHSGDICYKNFNYVEALNYYFRCQDFCERTHLNDLLAETLKSIGNVYSQHGDYASSERMYERSLAITMKLSDKTLQYKTLYNLVVVNMLLDKRDKAYTYFKRLKACGNKTMDMWEYDVLFTTGLIAEVEANLDSATQEYSKAIALCLKKRYTLQWLGSARSALARVYSKQDKKGLAIELLLENEKDAERLNQKDMLTSTYKELANVYNGIGDERNYIKYQSKYIMLNDDVFKTSSLNGLRNAEFMHELGKSKEKLRQLTFEKEEQQRNLNFLYVISIGGLLFICTLVGLLSLLYKQKRRLQGAYMDLYERSNETLNTEKDYRKELAKYEQKIRRLEEELHNKNHSKAGKDNSSPTASMPDSDTNDDLYGCIVKVMETSDLYLDCDFTIERLASVVNSTSHAVSKIINERTGQNFRSFLSKYRIHEAMIRFNDVESYGKYTVRAIAESVGYKSQSNFIAVFTKTTGVKPSLYQKIALDKHSANL